MKRTPLNALCSLTAIALTAGALTALAPKAEAGEAFGGLTIEFNLTGRPNLILDRRVVAKPYGEYTCRQGYVWREAKQGDVVCVTPQVRAQTAYDNQQAVYRYEPNGGAYGPDTCRQGYVWREAFAGDTVCVTPQTRAQAAYDNQQAPYRYAP